MSDYLALTSELAAAFAGFTALVTVLERKEDEATRHLNALRLRQMLELSLLAIAGGLLPSLFVQFGAHDGLEWRLAAAVLAITTLGLVRVNAIKGFHSTIRRIPEFSLVYARSLLAMGLLTVVSFLLASANLVRPQAAYILGVTTLLTIAGLQFLRMTSRTIFRLPMDVAGDGRTRSHVGPVRTGTTTTVSSAARPTGRLPSRAGSPPPVAPRPEPRCRPAAAPETWSAPLPRRR